MPKISALLSIVLALGSGLNLLLVATLPGSTVVNALCLNDYLCDAGVLTAYAVDKSDDPSSSESLNVFQALLKRQSASGYSWSDLGNMFLQKADNEKARYCFTRALKLAPRAPDVLLNAGNFYSETGETQKALSYLSQVLELNADYDDNVFAYYDALHPGILTTLAYGPPPCKRAAQSYLRHLMTLAVVPDLQKAWQWLAQRSYSDDRLAGEYIDFLLAKRLYDEAASSWRLYVGRPFENSDSVFNGDFENPFISAAFDWRVTPLDSVTASRDTSVSRSGRYSLRLGFSGTANLDYHHVAQKAVVHPGLYRFRAYVRTQAITTDQGLRFRIVDSLAQKRLDLETRDVTGSQDWQEVDVPVHIPNQTRLIEVQVIRRPSEKFDNKISGTAWIDDVSLSAVEQLPAAARQTLR